VNKPRKPTKAILTALKIEMGHPHMTASALATLYPEREMRLKALRRSNDLPRILRQPDAMR
jgi:hypothetical protein